jgi:arylsulfatase A-like enzyme
MRLVALLSLVLVAVSVSAAEKPNILYILCDDLGYGDVHCLNAQGKIATPNIDRLRGEGIAFTDAHSSSALCTPTRYGIMTGRYNWRTRLQSGVLGGYAPPLIEPGRLTVAGMLHDQGYHTGCIGKWHLGMNMATKSGKGRANGKNVDWSKPIKDGPTTRGFDSFFGIAASLDMEPFVFFENDRFTEPATSVKTFVRTGPAGKDFEAVNVLPTLAAKAEAFIAESAKDDGDKPFFLYLPLSAPHAPLATTEQFKGKSGINDYCDFVMETDFYVGQVLKALDEAKVADRTLVIFASDNGCAPTANFPEMLKHGHNPSYVFRGAKADIWDGGHHIPFIVRWPGHVKAGATSEQLVCLNDFMATAAEIVGVKLPDNAGEDSVSLLPALLGQDNGRPLHEAVVHHSGQGMFAIRQGQWKLELCPGSGGWASPTDAAARKEGLPTVQLYDMTADVGEKNNVASANPDTVARLTELLERYVRDGRSTPGEPQHNDVPVDVHKQKPPKKQPGD